MASLTKPSNFLFLGLDYYYYYSSPSPLSLSVTPRKQSSCRFGRRRLVATRAGPPGTNTYLFAFLFPLSLLAVTVFTSIQISDKLDRQFYQELEVNQSILEAEDEDEDEDEEVTPAYEEPPSQQRTRNRPKREAEIPGR
ncbi:uncharacterized protein LOC143636955 [Bidens hawaiensis]|uniref:uncharacterized protein LOC143636955 n=1 Tax=Bidens hawaiensis TaxID=980011 RepID=UPI0040493218